MSEFDHDRVWFDGDYSDDFFGWGHWEPEKFIAAIAKEYPGEDDYSEYRLDDVQHLYAKTIDDECFEFVEATVEGAHPITRFRT